MAHVSNVNIAQDCSIKTDDSKDTGRTQTDTDGTKSDGGKTIGDKYSKARAEHDRSGLMGPAMKLNDLIEDSIPQVINALPDSGNEMIEIHKGLVFILIVILALMAVNTAMGDSGSSGSSGSEKYVQTMDGSFVKVSN